MHVTIYGLRILGNKTYFYVGSTKGNPELRLRRHLEDCLKRKHVNSKFQEIVLKHNFMIVCDILEMTSANDRDKIEYHFIKVLLRSGHKLVNIANPIAPRQKLNKSAIDKNFERGKIKTSNNKLTNKSTKKREMVT